MRKKFITCSKDLLIENDKLSTSNSEIDRLLRGGFRSHILNEIVGTGGAGKTQLCLCLSLMVQLPNKYGGLKKAAVYICTEDVFPIKRLYELSTSFDQKFGIGNFLDNVFISHISDCQKLKAFLRLDVKYLAKFRDIGLIIIDSIGGLFRSDNLDIDYSDRSKNFIEIAAELRQLSVKFNCITICCNQMTDDISSGCSEPCLGLAWSNLVNSRFLITRSNLSSSRTFQTLFSPDLPTSRCNFSITKNGIT
ncbi:DNA repair protein XRCC3 homolog isoform X1 [Harmonia axyridis]|uniref:DNA repair protein XRCC3 homolog isoform X1 n=1 Tax=Harmonia axyridis TaxID=115357 RepID=UPI001E27922A|nr:DNA repair protein XRCC3 homolog isoform X1 [Harmonia axyridis]